MVRSSSAAHALHVREVSQPQPIQSNGHTARRLGVEPVKPDAESISPVPLEIFPDLDYLSDGNIYCPIAAGAGIFISHF
jgi:hypothetical protein